MTRGIVWAALTFGIVSGVLAAERPASLQRPLRRLPLESGGAPQFLAFSPDGRRVAGVRTSVGPRLTFTSLGRSSQVFVWNMKSGRLERSARGPVLRSVQFSPDGESLVGLYPAVGGQEVGPEGTASSPDGGRVRRNYGLMLWRLKQKTPLTPPPVLDLAIAELPSDPAAPRRAEFAGNEDTIAVSLRYGVRIWEVFAEDRDGVELREDAARNHAQPWAKYTDVQIAANGSKVVVVENGGFSTWECASRKKLGGWAGRQGSELTLHGVSGDGESALVELIRREPESPQAFQDRMAAGKPADPHLQVLERAVCLVETRRGGVRHERELAVAERVAGWAQDGTRIVTIDPTAALRVLDLTKHEVVAEGRALGAATVCAALSGDGTTLVTASTTEVAVWKLPQSSFKEPAWPQEDQAR